MPRVTIELFGVPRLRAGVASLTIDASTVGEALHLLAEHCPALNSTIVSEGRLHPAYRIGLNGDLAPLSSEHALADDDALLLLAADAGG